MGLKSRPCISASLSARCYSHEMTVFSAQLHSFVPFLGLIIDAFGELRDQQEQVKEDMEVKVDKNIKI